MWVLIVLMLVIVFLLWLNENQRRRSRQIYQHAQKLKRAAGGEGRFFESPYSSRHEFLKYMGQLLKYKKHEWIFIALGRDYTVSQFWLNKGRDKQQVSVLLDARDVARICKEHGYSRVLVGHNHPAGKLGASRLDRASLEKHLDALDRRKVSVAHFVFVAGEWQRYGLSAGQRIRRFLT